jgi:PAS domain S-box-containing protein
LRTEAITRRRAALAFGAVVLAYVGSAKLGIALSVAHGVVTPVWAPTGIALAALVLLGRRFWPAVAIGALLANATSGASLLAAAGISVGNTLEAVVGATLLVRVGFRPALDRIRDVLALVLLGAVVSTTISATNGVTILWLAGDIAGSAYDSDWLLWWVGDAMGALVVAPLIFVWSTRPWRRLGRGRLAEGLFLFALLATVSSIVFLAGHWRYPHLIFPLLIWAALRFQQLGSVTGNFVTASIAVAGAVNGSVPIGDGSATEIVQILEGLTAAVTVSLLILGAVLAERATAETKLERAAASLAEAQEVAQLGSWEWNIAPNRVTWSDELYRLFGLEPQSIDVTYETFLELVHPDDRERIGKTVGEALRDTRPFTFDHRVVLPSGDVRWLEGRGHVVSDERGSPARVVGTSQDATERHRIAELRDTILSTVSHELRTPLTAIVGFAMTLKDRGTDLSARAEAEIVASLNDQAQKLDRLLGDLLDVDRLRRGLIAPIFRSTDVEELAARVAAPYAADGYAIELRTSPAVAEIDPGKIERVLDNLIGNAVKHTPAGTKVVVRVEPENGSVLIVVEDEGPGVREGDREGIFELFNRGAEGSPVPGTGVGLSVVAQFAELHGGRAWVESLPNGGASFRVVLPAKQKRTEDDPVR